MLDKVAKAENDNDQKDIEIEALTTKKTEYKNKISLLNDEKRSLKELITSSKSDT